jgi:hypothetical protein
MFRMIAPQWAVAVLVLIPRGSAIKRLQEVLAASHFSFDSGAAR